MTKTPLAKSFAEISTAKQALSKLRRASEFGVAAEAWNEGISAITKVWNKAAAEFKNAPTFSNWNLKYVGLRKTDPLLQYVQQARNADEHTIQDSIQRNSGGFALNSATPGGHLFIKKLELRGDKITLDTGGTPFKLEVTPPHPELIVFTNRGQQYEIPKQHNGKNIDGRNPVLVLELAIDFYEGYLQKLRAEVPHQP
jgi:hypothetical protein